MSEESFKQHLVQQFPFRPDHPDFERLLEVVAEVEAWKAANTPADKAYANFADMPSVVYLASNRSAREAQLALPPEPTFPQTVEKMTDAWVEGFFIGVMFERRGGKRPEAGE